ncbi:unnamed protein product, partial [Mycena citricolor]
TSSRLCHYRFNLEVVLEPFEQPTLALGRGSGRCFRGARISLDSLAIFCCKASLVLRRAFSGDAVYPHSTTSRSAYSIFLRIWSTREEDDAPRFSFHS